MNLIGFIAHFIFLQIINKFVSITKDLYKMTFYFYPNKKIKFINYKKNYYFINVK